MLAAVRRLPILASVGAALGPLPPRRLPLAAALPAAALPLPSLVLAIALLLAGRGCLRCERPLGLEDNGSAATGATATDPNEARRLQHSGWASDA